MPLYDFACERCGHIDERFYKLEDCPESIPCSCGGAKRKMITVGHGGIFREWPTWLDGSVNESLKDSDRIRKGLDAPIETRTDLRRFMEANPHIQPL